MCFTAAMLCRCRVDAIFCALLLSACSVIVASTQRPAPLTFGPQQLPTSTSSSCALVGHTQRMQLAGCAPVELTLNACQGACESYAMPSSWRTLSINPRHILTSIGQCCNIMETRNVTVELQCAQGPRYMEILSARSCACFHCKKT